LDEYGKLHLSIYVRMSDWQDEFPIILRMKIRSKLTKLSGDIIIKRLTY
jgi:hypothetical protein